ncbi:MAG: histidine ammonia-lyase [Micavibrio aeruginosavorus]|uniref:Histidine ammonia-lyase n=1 Tax=Micavibrio aeruginosavorus TaxID=349221 RepID=A0A7T5R0P9_9BACT|nr:MAG: histidine ammonia-lyase [Micavibrio aeruginosavorus]
MAVFMLSPGKLDLVDLRRILRQADSLGLPDSCRSAMDNSVKIVERIVESGKIVYGVNTGFGKLAQKKIPQYQVEKLQENLVLSHATGTGPLLDDSIVRLMMVLKVNALAQGHSGIRAEIVQALLALLNAEIYPCVPAKGSVGASGDLAPLAHMSAVLLGHGQVRCGGKILPAAEGLAKAGLKPLRLGPKEGLALLNGTQLSTALALAGFFAVQDVFAAAVVAGAMTLEACKGSVAPFQEELQRVRGQPGQIAVAARLRALLQGSAILESHHNCGKVQDPYCLRCMPQVMGSCHDFMIFAGSVLEREANAVSDNPLVFSDPDRVMSGGNFHAEPVAMAADTLAVVIAEIGSISERRIAMIVDTQQSGLPPFLVKDAGVNSGFMIAHVTAAALTSENKQMSFPACVDSIPTSANQEDHVSMAAHGARRLIDMADNAKAIVAIELLAATQGMDFHHPLRSSAVLEDAHDKIRAVVPFYEQDRFFAPDIEAVKTLVGSGVFLAAGWP